MIRARFRFSIRHLLILNVAIAVFIALVVSFGNHFLWIARHAVDHQYLALTKIDDSTVASDCELSIRTFNGLSFAIPSSIIGSAKITRNSPTDVWLAFEDSTRRIHIPFFSQSIRTQMAHIPSELEGLTLPELLKVALAADSGNFSFAMSKSELRIHDWAMASRDLLNVDQNFDRYLQIGGEQTTATLIAASPMANGDPRRVRSVLVWESKNHQNFGTIWFGDSRNIEAPWIDCVAKSFTFNASEWMAPTELAQLTDTEILSRVIVRDSQTR